MLKSLANSFKLPVYGFRRQTVDRYASAEKNVPVTLTFDLYPSNLTNSWFECIKAGE